MGEVEYETLEKRRAAQLGIVTRLRNSVIVEQADANEVRIFKEQLDEIKVKHNAIIELLGNHEQANEEKVGEDATAFFIAYKNFRKLLDNRLDALTIVATPILIPPASSSSNVRVPKIDLPTFDGSTEKWVKFRDLFESLIHKQAKLTDVEKFQYLEMSMKLPSHESNVLNNFSISSGDYEAAWTAVCNRYNDIRKLLAFHISTLKQVKTMTSQTASELRRVIDIYSSHLSSLKKLGYEPGETDDFANMIIVQNVLLLLDDVTLKEWRKHHSSHSITWIELHQFLDVIWRSLSEVEPAQISSIQSNNSKPSEVKSNPKSKSLVTNTSNKSADSTCSVCSEAHFVYHCPTFLQMSVDDRFKQVREKQLCFNCLRKSHSVNACTSQSRCRVCQLAHNTLLHFPKKNVSNASDVGQDLSPHSDVFHPKPAISVSKPAESSRTTTASITSRIFFARHQTLLSTALVEVEDVSGGWHCARVLLDNGSESNLITKELAYDLGLPVTKTYITIQGISGAPLIIKDKMELSMKSKCSDYTRKKLEFLIVKTITSCVPPHTVNLKEFEIPLGFDLADPMFFESNRVDMLLGTEEYNEALMGNKIRLANGPKLIETHFGWIVGGAMQHHEPEPKIIIRSHKTSADSTFRLPSPVEEVPSSLMDRDLCSQWKPYFKHASEASVDERATFANRSKPNHAIVSPTALVQVLDVAGRMQFARVKLDPLGKENMMSKRLAARLKFKDSNTTVEMSSRTGECIHRFPFIIVDKIASVEPSKSFELDQDLPDEGLIADPTFNISSPVDMLLGARGCNKIFQSKYLTLSNGLNMRSSKFGWTISGSVPIVKTKGFVTNHEPDDNQKESAFTDTDSRIHQSNVSHHRSEKHSMSNLIVMGSQVDLRENKSAKVKLDVVTDIIIASPQMSKSAVGSQVDQRELASPEAKLDFASEVDLTSPQMFSSTSPEMLSQSVPTNGMSSKTEENNPSQSIRNLFREACLLSVPHLLAAVCSVAIGFGSF